MKKYILTYLLINLVAMPLWAATTLGKGVTKAAMPNDSTVVSSISINITDSLAVQLSSGNSQLTTNKSQLPITNNQLTNNPIFRTFPELEDGSITRTAASTDFDLYNEGLIPSNDPLDSVQHHIAKARAVIKEIREARKFIGYLDGSSLLELPVGIHKEIGGLAYDIGIASIKLKPQYAELEVYMQFTMPQNGKELTFMGKGIKFTKEGGIAGDATLELVGDYVINLNGDKSQIILKAGTFVTFDCSGFDKMALSADVKFSRDQLLPEDAKGDIAATGNVIASFETEINDWNDLVVELNLPPFQLPSMVGVSFAVRSAVFDFSDTHNAPAIRFPKDYQHPDIAAGLPNLWRGFYIRELTVKLPKQFKNKQDSSIRTTFTAFNVIIDNMGFSGDIMAENLIQIDDGSMNGWAYSLDSIGMSLQANQLVSGGFNGSIIVPINKDDQAFDYAAIINPGSAYIFNVSSPDSLEFTMFKAAEVELYPASYLEVAIVGNNFMPKANLHGKMTIAAKLGSGEKGVELADIAFENLQIQSVAPYIQAGAFSFGSEAAQQKMANFPVSINNIGFRNISDYEVALDFDLLLNLTGQSGGSFGADAGLSIIGEMPTGSAIQKWKYKNIEVHEIGIDVDGGAFKFQGNLAFYKNDPVYGEGFSGQVQAEFQPGIKVLATAIFGNVDGYRYWYADALASMPQGVPIFSGVGIYGFGGGAYYRMGMDTEGSGSSLGKTASGVVYIPKESAGLGLKATIEIGSHPKPEAFNGDATFEVAFFQGGGIRYISFKGNGYWATPPATKTLAKIKAKTQKLAGVVNNLENSLGSSVAGALLNQNAEKDQSVTQIYGEIGKAAGARGQISASIFISYDFENRVLHGNFEAYINVAGGIIQGVGDGGRAGWAVLHFAPEEWYVYVGTPEDRIGIKLGVGPVSANATSYLMVGTSIPGSPPPPENISRILGLDASDLDYMRDLNALGNGAGFAFGANFGIDTGDLTFLMFYARFAAGAGFDIMLKNYGSAQCAGQSGPIGVNGWYANGQAYAYFEGKIGIKVKLFGMKKRINIIDLQAAAILQAKLPNPFWMRGIVGGSFNVLGGLVKGSCKFEITIGEECEIIGGSVLEGITVIADITPVEGIKDVDVFTTPQAVFNMPINQVFEMVDTDDKKKSFRIVLDEFKLTQGGSEIPGKLSWNDDNDVAAFDSHEVFPSEKEIKVNVQVSFEQIISSTWVPVFGLDGKKILEKRESTFTSGIAPDYIPLKNVEYSYPVVSQLNFYKNEYDKGYIKLKKGQSYLFEVDAADWQQKGRFTSTSGSATVFNFAYSTGNKQVDFTLPADMETNTIYAFELVNLPIRKSGSIDRNVSKVTNKLPSEGDAINMELTTKKAEGTIEELQEKAIFSAHYKTSQYTTFVNRVNAQINLGTARGLLIPWDIHYLINYITTDDYYDQAEINGNQYTGGYPLIALEANISGNTYFDNYINPLIYNDYPIDGNITITNRPIDSLGLIPIRAINVYQTGNNKMLKQADISLGSYVNTPVNIGYKYNLAYYMAYDFYEIQQKVLAKYISSSSVTPRIEKIIVGGFPVIQNGNYKVKIKYRLPGKTVVNSSKQLILKYD